MGNSGGPVAFPPAGTYPAAEGSIMPPAGYAYAPMRGPMAGAPAMMMPPSSSSTGAQPEDPSSIPQDPAAPWGPQDAAGFTPPSGGHLEAGILPPAQPDGYSILPPQGETPGGYDTGYHDGTDDAAGITVDSPTFDDDDRAAFYDDDGPGAFTYTDEQPGYPYPSAPDGQITPPVGYVDMYADMNDGQPFTLGKNDPSAQPIYPPDGYAPPATYQQGGYYDEQSYEPAPQPGGYDPQRQANHGHHPALSADPDLAYDDYYDDDTGYDEPHHQDFTEDTAPKPKRAGDHSTGRRNKQNRKPHGEAGARELGEKIRSFLTGSAETIKGKLPGRGEPAQKQPSPSSHHGHDGHTNPPSRFAGLKGRSLLLKAAAILAILWLASPPSTAPKTITPLDDVGTATITDVTPDYATQTATITVQNDTEMVLDEPITLVAYARMPVLMKPWTWLSWRPVGTCPTDPVPIDPAQTGTVTTPTCPYILEGWHIDAQFDAPEQTDNESTTTDEAADDVTPTSEAGASS